MAIFVILVIRSEATNIAVIKKVATPIQISRDRGIKQVISP